MLIRSQDKTKLVNMDNSVLIDFIKRQTGTIILYANTEKNCWDIGTYSTEEKTIKVLDMIQKHHEQIKESEFLGCENAHYVERTLQMPQDSEVE